MRKRWLAIGLTAVMMTGMVGASAQAAEKSTDTDEQVTLELFWQKSNTNVIQEIIDKFEAENPNIKIELTATSSDTGKQIFQTRMATNEPMDLVQHWPSQAEFRAMCKEGRMVDLSGYDWTDNIIDTYYDMSCVDDKLYSVPLSINAGVVAYNKDIFEENNLEVPSTWDELIKAADTLKAADVTPFIFSNGDKENCSQKFHIMTAAVADDKWNPYDFYVGMYEGSGAKFADNDYSKKAAERLYLLSDEYAQNDPMSTNYDLSMQMFANGEGAMMITGTWAQSDIEKNNPEINMGMFALPTDDGVNMMISGIDPCIAAMTGTGKEEYAAKFLEFVSRTENAQIYTDYDKSPSPIKGVKTENPTIDLVLGYIEEGKAIPWWRDYISTGVVSDEADLAQAFLMDGDMDAFLEGEEEIVLRQED
ncbi:ABC transporter substrate-binding protein [Murimonas intestini]|uniref:Raffinose/stachyose/melibiose transport system substrate-binding protein n=1 Tax=Murimonas intestini TaxID=1337051 RepID=A0AB73T615_9FIRM|nr:extracellular solute-binding protein [Murimonas intestini]MCR1841911.1 extracellular solute-binding protein [Murimonas intestini]MCR1864981.1 extracellular solute-binding protein [Murimonas intestini]MCR1885678.1 extracellular solute-binding protein [Murimonas intestini]